MIIWNDIDTVLLDMDGTLLDLNFDNYFWQEYLPVKWAELHGLDISVARARLYPKFTGLEGTLSWYCLDYWSEQLQIDILALKADVEHLIRERPYALEFLQLLTDLNKPRVLVTNAHLDLIEMKMKRTGIGSYLDHVFCSHQLGFPKESGDFWKNLHAVYPFNPEKTLLIDDNYSVLRSAQNYGIRHLVTIAQPDSSKPPREAGEFPAIDSFSAIIQGAGQ